MQAHNLPGPMTKEFEARREAAVEAKLRGEAPGKVVRLGKNKFVELAREKTDPVFVVIAEFGNARHSSFCDAVDTDPAPPNPCAFPSDGTPQTFDGPEHNKIAQPNRAVDNSTLWQPDYNVGHYQNMYFNRMAKYFEHQSSNRYSVMAPGDAVHGWVKVPFNEARYGRDFCGGIVCNNTWFLIRDAMSFWVQGQLAAGKTMLRSPTTSSSSTSGTATTSTATATSTSRTGSSTTSRSSTPAATRLRVTRIRALTPSGATAGMRSVQGGGPGGRFRASTSVPVAPSGRPVSGGISRPSGRRLGRRLHDPA